MSTLFVGIDVSKANLDVACLPGDQAFRVPNTPEGHQNLIRTLLPLAAQPGDIRVVLESTGGLELPAALALEEAGIPLAIIKPERTRHFAKAHGQLAKTDSIDAAILAKFAHDVKLTIVPLPSEDLRNFRELLDRRDQLIEMRTMEANRLAATTNKPTQANLDKHIAWLNRQIKEIEAKLDRLIETNPVWAETDRILQSIPGIGVQVSRLLIGHLPELGQVSRKVIGYLVGVAPLPRDSGVKESPRHIVGGRWQVRNGLYMASLSAITHNPLCKSLYARLIGKGKSSKAALIAVAHKLLTIANAMVAQKTTWQPSEVA